MKKAVRPLIKRSVQLACTRRPFSDVICWHGSRRSRKVALTFDDGPEPGYTQRVLEQLAARNARATFFLLGDRVVEHPEIVRDIAAAGHEIGIHGWDHTDIDLPGQTVRTDDALAELGIDAQLFRPPRGGWTPALVFWMVRNHYTTVMWSLDSFDCERGRGCDDAREPRYDRVTGGDIVLFHDDNDYCVREVPELLARIEDRGLEPACVSQVLGRP